MPFLQEVLADFQLVPIVVGEADPETVAEVLEYLWGDTETLIEISTDLSHYRPYKLAKRVDCQTTGSMEARSGTIEGEQACGCRPLNGLLKLAKRKLLEVRTLDPRNSDDTAGNRDEIVGYGSYAACQ